MEGRSSSAAERSAQVINGYSNLVREVAQRQTFFPLPAQNEFNMVDDISLLRAADAGSRERGSFVCRPYDPVEQTHHRLFNHQWLLHRPGCHLLEKPPLREVCGGVSPTAREVERSVRMRVEGWIKGPHYILHYIDFHAELVAAVSLDADRVS